MPTCEEYPEGDGSVDDPEDTQKDDECQDAKGCVRVRINIRMPEKEITNWKIHIMRALQTQRKRIQILIQEQYESAIQGLQICIN